MQRSNIGNSHLQFGKHNNWCQPGTTPKWKSRACAGTSLNDKMHKSILHNLGLLS